MRDASDSLLNALIVNTLDSALIDWFTRRHHQRRQASKELKARRLSRDEKFGRAFSPSTRELRLVALADKSIFCDCGPKFFRLVFSGDVT